MPDLSHPGGVWGSSQGARHIRRELSFIKPRVEDMALVPTPKGIWRTEEQRDVHAAEPLLGLPHDLASPY